MRILFVVHKFPPESLGGTEIYTWSLAQALARANHDIHVFYPRVGASQAITHTVEEGVHLWRVPVPSQRLHEDPLRQYWHTFRDLRIEAVFKTLLSDIRPDVAHFQHVQGVSARLIELAVGRPRVVTLHDYWYFCANSQLVRPDRSVCSGPGWGWKCVDCATARADLRALQLARPLVALPFAYRNRYLRHLLDQVDLLVSPSRFLRQQYEDQGFPAEKIVVLENGLDMGRLRETPDPPLPQPAARPHFGFLGSLAWQKGVHILIDAFNRLPEHTSLTIYGSETVFPEYVAQLRAAARHPHIRFAGQLDHRHVGAALQQMDCLIVPSLWYENSPVTIQEAFASGVPVIASRLGALTEKVQDGRTGRLFDAGRSEALARVLLGIVENPEQLTRLRANIRPGPTIEQHAQEIVSCYEALRLSGRPTSS